MTHSAISRRRMLQRSVCGVAALGVGTAIPQGFVAAAEDSERANENVLVVIELSGGNDGLNTVVPYSNEVYREARPNLSLGVDEVLKVDDNFGFHPSLRGVSDLLEQGQASVVHAVGYENPNRSHFESMDIWHSCLRKGESRQDGWLGRYLEQRIASVGGDVPAIHLGHRQQPFALESLNVRVPTVKELEAFRLLGDDSGGLRELLKPASATVSESSTNELLDFLQNSTRNAVSASRRVTDATKDYQSATQYPESQLARELKVVAQLIDAELSTRVYYLQLDGFDTHAQQPDAHAALLGQWSDAVAAFMNDLNAQGHSDRVTVMTFSEFGRRVAENASSGTDHGAAGPMFFCGGKLQPGLIGQSSSLTDLQQGDLKHHVDFRQVYATVLEDWLGADSAAVLGKSYAGLPIFG